MNDDRNHGRKPLRQAQKKHPADWQSDLNPNDPPGQSAGRHSDARVDAEWTAFHLRKRGLDLGGVNDEELERVPIVAEGEPLQPGATYADLMRQPPREFTAGGDMTAGAGHAYAPKDKVPYQLWNRLIGETKPGQE